MNPGVRELHIPSAAPRKTHMELSLRTGEGGGVGLGSAGLRGLCSFAFLPSEIWVCVGVL